MVQTGSILALIVSCVVIFGIIAEGFHDIFAASCPVLCIHYLTEIIVGIGVHYNPTVVFCAADQ